MDRRQFLSLVGVGAFHKFGGSKFNATALQMDAHDGASASRAGESKTFGSGHFGDWITDRFGLPAYRYTCNQVSDPKAISPVHKIWRDAADHTHQVGNDRLVAAVSNYGYVQVRTGRRVTEISERLFTRARPLRSRHRISYRWKDRAEYLLSGEWRIVRAEFLGEGYFRKIAKGNQYEVDQVIFAPFGDDPVLFSMATLQGIIVRDTG